MDTDKIQQENDMLTKDEMRFSRRLWIQEYLKSCYRMELIPDIRKMSRWVRIQEKLAFGRELTVYR